MILSPTDGQAAFATKRFDREKGMRVPMQSLAAFTGANYQSPGALDYTNFLRATQMCTNDAREKVLAFERVVFNIAFNNRDDHPKNFSYLMSPDGSWTLAPAYDVTYCEGPDGYHQMDVMGEALEINRKHVLTLAKEEAELTPIQASLIIEKICDAAAGFANVAKEMLPKQITAETQKSIQNDIDMNIKRLLK